MNCKEIIELLPLYIENMLADNEMAAIREHLSGCKACGEELSFLLSIKKSFGALEEIEPSAEFKSQLQRKLIEEGKSKSGKSLPLKMIKRYFAVAASAAVIAISVMALNSGVHELGNTGEVLGAKTENAKSLPDEEAETSAPKAEAARVTDDAKIESAPITPRKTEKSNSSNDKIASDEAVHEEIFDASLDKGHNSAAMEYDVEEPAFIEPAAFEEDYVENADDAPETDIEARSFVAFSGYEKVTFYLELPNDEALLVLANYEEENGVYKISLEDFYDVTGKLMMICGGDYKTESLNEEYNELLSGGDENAEALLEIEEICKWGYIIVDR